MRMLISLLLLIFLAVVIAGIAYVPEHDGQLIDLFLLVILPTAGICWCIARLLTRPTQRS